RSKPATRVLNARGILQRLGQLGLRQLPLISGAAGDETDITPAFFRKRSISGYPIPHALFASIIGSRRQAEIPKFLLKICKQARGVNYGISWLERILEATIFRRTWHELRDALGTLRTDRLRVESALPPNQSDKWEWWQSVCLGLLLHEATNSLDQR